MATVAAVGLGALTGSDEYSGSARTGALPPITVTAVGLNPGLSTQQGSTAPTTGQIWPRGQGN